MGRTITIPTVKYGEWLENYLERLEDNPKGLEKMANDLNVLALVGRLTRDSELRYSSGGMAFFQVHPCSEQECKEGWTMAR